MHSTRRRLLWRFRSCDHGGQSEHKGLTKLLRRVGLSIKLISADPSKKHSTQSVMRVLCVAHRGATHKELAFREGLLRVEFLRSGLALDSTRREVKAAHAECQYGHRRAHNGCCSRSSGRQMAEPRGHVGIAIT